MSPEESTLVMQDSVLSVVSSTWSLMGGVARDGEEHGSHEEVVKGIAASLEAQDLEVRHTQLLSHEASLERGQAQEQLSASAHVGEPGHHQLHPPPTSTRSWPLEDAALKRAARVRFFERKWDLLSCFADQVGEMHIHMIIRCCSEFLVLNRADSFVCCLPVGECEQRGAN